MVKAKAAIAFLISIPFDIFLYNNLVFQTMLQQRDRMPLLLAFAGLVSIGYAIKLTISELTGRILYGFLGVQSFILLYLLYVAVSRSKELWTEYRWSPDRLR